MSYWQDKVAMVTGGSAGFGAALSRALVSAGSRVVVIGRDAARLAATVDALGAEPGRALAIVADVTCDDEVTEAFARTRAAFGQLDGLFNIAGMSDRGEAIATPLARFDELWRINFLATARCAQAAIADLRRSRGHLVLMGSLASKSASRLLGAYPASKFAVAALAQQIRLEIDPSELHTLLVCPGPIARSDSGHRYDDLAVGLPEEVRRPGGGVKLKGLDPHRLARLVLDACERRRPELVVPWKARLLFALSQVSPTWGDWLVRKMT